MRLATALALTLGSAAAEPPVMVRLQSSGAHKCAVVIGGQTVDAADLQAYLKAHPLARREFEIVGLEQVPFRCSGSVISVLQRSGFEKIGFVSEPSPQR